MNQFKQLFRSKIFTLIVLSTLLLFKFSTSYGQTPTPVPTAATATYVYVGSLTYSASNLSNYQKLKISVVGGGWASQYVGETTFYIANRGGLVINEVTMGSAGISGWFSLQAYQNGNNTDFYLYSPSSNYSAITVLSYLLENGSTGTGGQYVTITTSSTAPAETLITPLTINQVMTTDASGNIALNSANTFSQYKLAVNGAFIATSAYVKLYNNWPDYVFMPDYHLPKLQDVKTYIDQNHHLPDMPSAEDIAKNGLNLGESNKALTKKVEELTLYLIEKENEINADATKIKADEEKLKAYEERLNKLENAVKLLFNNGN